MRILVAALSIALAAAGCSSQKAPGAEPAGQPGAAAAPKAAAPAGEVIARVGNRVITKAQFDGEIERLPEQNRSWTATPQGRRHIVEQLVEGALVEAEAARRGVDQKPAVAQKLEGLRRQILREALLDELVPDAPISDAEAQKYFTEHPEEFRSPETVKVLELVVATEDDAKKAKDRLGKGGDFASVAREVSKDPFGRERGGDVPEFSKPMRPELFEAASSKKPGDLIGPVKTPMGFHVMKLVRRNAAQEKSFDQVKESLKMRLRALKRQQAYMDLLKQARENNKPAIEESFVGAETPVLPPAKAPAPGLVQPAAGTKK